MLHYLCDANNRTVKTVLFIIMTIESPLVIGENTQYPAAMCADDINSVKNAVNLIGFPR